MKKLALFVNILLGFLISSCGNSSVSQDEYSEASDTGNKKIIIIDSGQLISSDTLHLPMESVSARQSNPDIDSTKDTSKHTHHLGSPNKGADQAKIDSIKKAKAKRKK